MKVTWGIPRQLHNHVGEYSVMTLQLVQWDMSYDLELRSTNLSGEQLKATAHFLPN
jgi:hypothetical protein